jgi:hypothetical protein
VIGPIPLRLAIKLSHNASMVFPRGETTPKPVMTTRFFTNWLLPIGTHEGRDGGRV